MNARLIHQLKVVSEGATAVRVYEQYPGHSTMNEEQAKKAATVLIADMKELESHLKSTILKP